MAQLPNVCVPLKLDAFCLNSAVCDGPSKIAPLNQPDYARLLLDGFNRVFLKDDVLEDADLHSSIPGKLNNRVTNLATGTPRNNRLGVYLHWILPRGYRSGTASTPAASAKQKDRCKAQGFKASSTADANADLHQTPDFRPVPNRWLVIRQVDRVSLVAGFPEFQGWIIESDRLRSVSDFELTADIEVESAPFIDPNSPLNEQQDAFIGIRHDLDGWSEKLGVRRVPLSVVHSGNPLLADYQPHNTNVFSMIDNFSYGDPKKPQYLSKAVASYYVVGWHENPSNDPLSLQPGTLKPPTYAARLQNCVMQLKDSSGSAGPWAQTAIPATEGSLVVCHGAMYSVNWDLYSKPTKSPADDASIVLSENMPIAVGSNPLDALLAYVHAHVDDPANGVDIKAIESSIIMLQTLLLKQDDDADSQQHASDLLLEQNFTRTSGGVEWHLAGQNAETVNKPTVPSSRQLQILNDLNQAQELLNVCTRNKESLQWQLFSAWWKYVSSFSVINFPMTPPQAVISSLVKQILSQLDILAGTDQSSHIGRVQALSGMVDFYSDSLPCEAGTSGRFYQQKDPTVLVGGIGSGWPSDYMDTLLVRLDSQLAVSTPVTTSPVPDNSFDHLFTTILSSLVPLPASIRSTVSCLITEFLYYLPGMASQVPTQALSKSPVVPQYHDSLGNDTWTGQAWFPLFVEWEVQYYHIPYEYWRLQTDVSGRTRYGIAGVDLSSIKDIADDRRLISGRTLLLPQPGFSIENCLQQVFKNTPPADLEKIYNFPPVAQQALLSKIRELEYFSFPLTGLLDQLATKVKGTTHVKPFVRQPGKGLEPIPDALSLADDIGVDERHFALIGDQTGSLPFGYNVHIPNADKFSPYKPVVHGQMFFTKLNIIDKFGQAICGIEPQSDPNATPFPIYPCASEYYACSVIKSSSGVSFPNTVVEGKDARCEFVQIAPAINQPARLNSYFLVKDSAQKWRPTNDWENPVWGWLLVNYADYGLQIFLADGTFYREVRVGGPKGTSKGVAWLPFEPPPSSEVDVPTQLDLLIDQLLDEVYLQSFFDMVNAALDKTAHPPSAYASHLPSTAGLPLALVNAGWSLELGADPGQNQSLLSTVPQERALCAMDDPKHHYEFSMKIGDKDRTFDGLIGYYPAVQGATSGKKPTSSQSDVDLSKLYTYFPSSSLTTKDRNPTIRIGESNYPKLSPYYYYAETIQPDELVMVRDKQLCVVGAILNPFVSVHAYTGILPIQALRLPPWTVEVALKKLTIFYHMGPLVIPKDVPKQIDPQRILDQRYNLSGGGVVPNVSIPIPALSLGSWNWLQPYITKDKEKLETSKTEYNAIAIAHIDGRPKFEQGPYTAVEGFLQLTESVVKPN